MVMIDDGDDGGDGADGININYASLPLHSSPHLLSTLLPSTSLHLTKNIPLFPSLPFPLTDCPFYEWTPLMKHPPPPPFSTTPPYHRFDARAGCLCIYLYCAFYWTNGIAERGRGQHARLLIQNNRFLPHQQSTVYLFYAFLFYHPFYHILSFFIHFPCLYLFSNPIFYTTSCTFFYTFFYTFFLPFVPFFIEHLFAIPFSIPFLSPFYPFFCPLLSIFSHPTLYPFIAFFIAFSYIFLFILPFYLFIPPPRSPYDMRVGRGPVLQVYQTNGASRRRSGCHQKTVMDPIRAGFGFLPYAIAAALLGRTWQLGIF